MNHFLRRPDDATVNALVESALTLKRAPHAARNLGQGKTAVLLFLNPSLRTRLSTQKAALNLGMECIVMNVGQEGWQLEFEDGAVMDGDKAEHVKEAAGVISAYADVIGIRTFAGLKDRERDYAEEVLENFCRHATVPVINMESATVHPLQSLADVITIREHRPTHRPKVVLTWAPHPRALPQAVANSFADWMGGEAVDLVITHPEGYELPGEFTAKAAITHDWRDAYHGADFVYAKNWSSYHQYGKVLSTDSSWMVTPEKMALTRQARFMHCLPVRRNVVVADAVIDSPKSLVLEQAANREWAAQAVFKKILEA